ncbi:CREB-binding protein-like isoform X1 [Zophobas morio]|uniref:CREB-binding protein-like isoform X1 n=1 Tax=Zophobas morio TaxID=2755281 RepID=UPI0030834877
MDDMDEMDTFRDHTPKIRAGDIVCKKSRKLKVIKAYHRFLHACTCTESDCQNAGCDEMKSTVVHFKMCTRTPKKDCTSCRQLLALCHYHAKRSQDCESKLCIVPYCAKMKHLMKLKRRAKRAARRQKEAAEASTSAVETVEINEEWEVNSISDSDSDSDSVVVVGPEGAQEQEPEDAQVCRIFTRFAPCLWRVVEPSTSLNLSQVGFTPYSNTTTTSNAPSVIPESAYTIPIRTSPVEVERIIPNVPCLDDPQSEAQLKMLLRAHKCLTEESQGVASWPCFESNCGVMKQVLKHIYSCGMGTMCTVLHCSSSKNLLNHWSNCTNSDCQLCMRVRASQGRYNASGVPFVERSEASEREVANEGNKDWQRSIYPAVRERMVKKIIEIVPLYVPTPSPNDPRFRDLITYAKQAEVAMFNKANSSEEYFRLVLEATHRVQQEMRRKWYRRRRHPADMTNIADYNNIPEVQVPIDRDINAPTGTVSTPPQIEVPQRFVDPPRTPERNEMLRALKSNPRLMANFIRSRQEMTAALANSGPWSYNTLI